MQPTQHKVEHAKLQQPGTNIDYSAIPDTDLNTFFPLDAEDSQAMSGSSDLNVAEIPDTDLSQFVPVDEPEAESVEEPELAAAPDPEVPDTDLTAYLPLEPGALIREGDEPPVASAGDDLPQSQAVIQSTAEAAEVVPPDLNDAEVRDPADPVGEIPTAVHEPIDLDLIDQHVPAADGLEVKGNGYVDAAVDTAVGDAARAEKLGENLQDTTAIDAVQSRLSNPLDIYQSEVRPEGLQPEYIAEPEPESNRATKRFIKNETVVEPIEPLTTVDQYKGLIRDAHDVYKDGKKISEEETQIPQVEVPIVGAELENPEVIKAEEEVADAVVAAVPEAAAVLEQEEIGEEGGGAAVEILPDDDAELYKHIVGAGDPDKAKSDEYAEFEAHRDKSKSKLVAPVTVTQPAAVVETSTGAQTE